MSQPDVSSPDRAARNDRDAAQWLCSARAVRARARDMLALAEQEALESFRLNPDRIKPAADYVLDVIRANYPSLDIPFHSRWRHFGVGGLDRWAGLAETLEGSVSGEERARIQFDLAVTSVLLDAGAGSRWRYREPGTGEYYGRSEGLAVASFDIFTQGLFSGAASAPLRADAEGLAAVTAGDLARAMQVNQDNPLVGLEARAALLRRLGEALAAAPDLFGARNPRVGGLFDHLSNRAAGGRLPAADILDALLTGLGAVWPDRPVLGGVPLGDVWRHPAIRAADATDGWVPFHKLSQWLAYSLVEPLEEYGIEVTGLDDLTGLPEYRNGGLLIDLGVLALRDPNASTATHAVDSPLVVEWRALTVALLDRLGEEIRTRLGMDAASLPLIKVLEGGTWQAGRHIARELRGETAPPPIQVVSDGTVF